MYNIILQCLHKVKHCWLCVKGISDFVYILLNHCCNLFWSYCQKRRGQNMFILFFKLISFIYFTINAWSKITIIDLYIVSYYSSCVKVTCLSGPHPVILHLMILETESSTSPELILRVKIHIISHIWTKFKIVLFDYTPPPSHTPFPCI